MTVAGPRRVAGVGRPRGVAVGDTVTAFAFERSNTSFEHHSQLLFKRLNTTSKHCSSYASLTCALWAQTWRVPDAAVREREIREVGNVTLQWGICILVVAR